MHRKQLKSANKLRAESLSAVVMADDRTVRWNGQLASTTEGTDQGVVRSSAPIPRDVDMYVFEVEVLTGGEDMMLGLSTFDREGKRKSDTAFTYSSRTGNCRAPNNLAVKHPNFQAGDIVSCGVSFMGNAVDPFVFFAKNGQMLEPFFPWKPSDEVFAFVSSSSSETSVRIFFGSSGEQDDALQVDWAEQLREIQRERHRARMQSITWDKDSICEKVIRDFLFNQGYIETLRAMDEEDAQPGITTKQNNGPSHLEMDRMEEPDDHELDSARERKHVRDLVLEGRSVEATAIVRSKWPSIMDTSLGLDLRVQSLVELILKGQYKEAVMHSRAEIWPYVAAPPNPKSKRLAIQALGLFAHPDPVAMVKGTKQALFAPGRRRTVADALNRALLFHPNPPEPSALERILSRLAECAEASREKAGGYGVPFRFE